MLEYRRRVVMAAAAAATLAISGGAWANDGTPPWIHQLVQEGQDVRITLAIVGNGEPGMGDTFTLVRSDSEGEEVELFEDREFSDDDVELASDECRGGGDDLELCQTGDQECSLDCDDDGTPECIDYDDEGWCDVVNYIEVLDECLPAGETTYTLIAPGWGDSEDEQTIEVTEEEECGGDADADGDSDGGALYTTTSGCAAAGGGSPLDPAPYIVFALFGVGLIAFKLGRNSNT